MQFRRPWASANSLFRRMQNGILKVTKAGATTVADARSAPGLSSTIPDGDILDNPN